MVALVTDRWDPSGGGRERYLADLAGYLTRRGAAPRLYASGGGAGVAGFVSVPVVSAFGSGVAEWTFERAIRRLLAAEPGPILAARPADGATHVQLHSGLLADAFEAERDALEGARRLLYRPALALNLKRRLLLLAEARVLRASPPPRVMVFSRALADAVSRRHGVPAEAITIAPPGIDERAFRPPESVETMEPPIAPTFLLVAHNFLLKGLAPALEALHLARRLLPDARLLVVGAGRREPFVRRARALGLAGAVEFLGPRTRPELAALYRSSTALLHPTFFDPFSLVAAEALACGCPVVTTSRNGASEVIERGRHGFVVDDPRDADALARAVLDVADREANRAMRREAAALGAGLGFTRHAERVAAWLGLS